MLKLEVKSVKAHSGAQGERDKTARHNWWPVSYSSDLLADETKPLSVTLFGEPLVIFRAADGNLQCVADVCPHKSSALSQGYVENGELVCRYHGWRFGSEGQCRHPQELAEKKRAALYHYPVLDDGLLIWVYPAEGEPVEFINPAVEYARRAGLSINGYKPREFLFDQPWELWASSFVDGTHHEYAHPKTFLQTQRNSLGFVFDEAVNPAAMVVHGTHDRSVGVMAYLTFSPVGENQHKQFLTLFPTSSTLPPRLAYGIFRTFRIAELLYNVVYEDYYLIVKQMERIQQGASKWGIRGKYGSPASDRFIDWHKAHEEDKVWFERYATDGSPVLRQEQPTPAGRIPLLEDSGVDLGPASARAGAPFHAAYPTTWTNLNLYDRVVKAIAERAAQLTMSH